MKATPYSDVELAWIKVHRKELQKKAYAAFCMEFNRTDVSLHNYKDLCGRNGWRTGRNGRFKPGVPHLWQKMARCVLSGNGTERVSHYGYVYFSLDNPATTRWEDRQYILKHRHLWGNANGPVPDGMCLKCLDGDKANTDPSNWELIPRGLLARLNGSTGRNYDKADPALKPAIMAIAKLEHKARNL